MPGSAPDVQVNLTNGPTKEVVNCVPTFGWPPRASGNFSTA